PPHPPSSCATPTPPGGGRPRARPAHRRDPRADRLHARGDRQPAQERRDMSAKTAEEKLARASEWWSTSIIDIEPGKIAIRGYPIQELIGRLGFPSMVWLMLRG